MDTSPLRYFLPRYLEPLPRRDPPQMRDILQGAWAVLFTNVKVMKDEERTGSCQGLERLMHCGIGKLGEVG